MNIEIVLITGLMAIIFIACVCSFIGRNRCSKCDKSKLKYTDNNKYIGHHCPECDKDVIKTFK